MTCSIKLLHARLEHVPYGSFKQYRTRVAGNQRAAMRKSDMLHCILRARLPQKGFQVDDGVNLR
jgi:hypothetical protein